MRSRTSLCRVSKAVPWFSISSWFQPLPTPNRKRPPDSWSIDDTSLAVWIGSRWVPRQTPVPHLRFLAALGMTAGPCQAFVLPVVRCFGFLRPPRFDLRQHLFDQLPGLADDRVAVRPYGTQDELLDAHGGIFGDAVKDHLLIADREVARGIAAGAFLVSRHGGRQDAVAGASEIERERRAVMILVDHAAGLGRRLLDGRNDLADIGRQLCAGLPAGAVARRAPDRGLRRAADPHR